MKILYHHRTRSRDGQRVHIDGLVGALLRAHHEVLIVEPRPRGEPHASDAAGPPRASALRELAELAYNVPERWQLLRAVRRFRPDAIYSRHALFATSALAVARALTLPLMIEVNAPLALERSRHGGLRFARHARRLETRTLNGADRVVVVTRAMGELLVAQGVARERIDVHWNGLEPDALTRPLDGAGVRARLGLADRIVLGFVGFVRDWNRLDRTFPFLQQERRALLVVVGEGPDRPRLEREAERLGVAAQVRFVGTLARAQVLDAVAAFDVALLPEVTEYASPLKLLDYFAAARAVLVPDRPNLREVIVDGENGVLFDPADDGSFAVRLAELVAAPERRARLGAAGRATIDRLGLTWDRNAERVVAELTAAVARREGAAR